MSAILLNRPENFESLVKLWDAQLTDFGKQLKNYNLKLNLITRWISTRFGVDFPEIYPELCQDIHRDNVNQSNVETETPHSNYKLLSPPLWNTTFHKRYRQIKASIRKRRCSSLSQQSAISSRYPYIRTPSSTFSYPPEANNDTIIPEKIQPLLGHNSTQSQSLAESANSKCIRVSGVITHTNVVNCGESTPLLIPEERNCPTNSALSTNQQCKAKNEGESTTAITATPSQKRGRPKKRPDPSSTLTPTNPTPTKKSTPMICDECGKVCKGPSSLRSHKLSHSNERPFKCVLCPKAFKQKHHLDFHRLTHGDDAKKWTCRYCERGFIAQRDLLRHERTHTGERPFPCTYKDCCKSFNVKQHLTLHIRTHTGERPYRCLICEKTFTQANSLRIHKKIHAKE